MASCRLCGYGVSLDTAEQQKPCPVCGEASFVSLENDLKGMAVGCAAPSAWSRAEAQQQSPSSEKVGLHRGDSTKELRSSCINPELLSLLQLVPEPQQRKAKAQRDVRATGALTPPRPVDTPPTDSNAIYIRPHADPLRHLKGRYNTQPRIVRAVSMSALHRLADPLTGHDSMEALAPQARRRREERIKRLMENGHERGTRNKACELAGHVLKESRNSVDLQGIGGRVVSSQGSLSRGNSSSIGTSAKFSPVMTSVDVVRHQHRNSADSTGLGVGRAHNQRRRLKTPSESTTRGRPLQSSHPRKSARRRTTPSLHRKRVATMRDVDGWVREVDPLSVRRRLSLKRRGPTVDKNRGSDGKPTTEREEEDSSRCPEAKRDSIGGCGIFLTEIGPNNARPRASGDVNTMDSGKSRQGSARGEGCRTDRFWSETVAGEKAVRETSRVRFEEGKKPAPLVLQEGFSKRTTKFSRDCRAGAGKRRGRTTKRVVDSFRRTQQQKIPPSTKALCPSRERNAVPGSLEKRLAWEGSNQASEGTSRTTIRDCEWRVGNSPATLAVDGDQSEVCGMSSLQGPNAVFSPPEGGAIHKTAGTSETARRGLPRRGIAPATFQRPASATNLIPLRVDNSATPGHSRNVWQCLRDASNDRRVGSLIRLFDDSIRAAAVATAAVTVGPEKENPRAASVATTTQRDNLPRRNGRDRQRRTEFDLAAEARQRPEPMYGKQSRRTLPTVLVYRSEASDSATLLNTSAQKLARSRDAVRCRGKRRSRTNEPAGLMQRLDRNPVKVGNALVAGLGGNCRGRDGVSTQHLRHFGLGSWGAAEVEDRPPLCGSGSYRGKLLASAVPVPLLHVGGGYGFRLRR